MGKAAEGGIASGSHFVVMALSFFFLIGGGGGQTFVHRHFHYFHHPFWGKHPYQIYVPGSIQLPLFPYNRG